MEQQVLLRMVLEDDFSVTEAVAQIIARTTELGEPSRHGELIIHHMFVLTENIVDLSKQIPHGQQLKLVEFVVHLQRTLIPHPNGGVLESNGYNFWVDLPSLGGAFRAYELDDRPWYVDPSRRPQSILEYENCTGFAAQIFEIGAVTYRSIFPFISRGLRQPFDTQHNNAEFEPPKTETRLACLWFLYAPKRVRYLCLPDHTVNDLNVGPPVWDMWKRCFQNAQTRWLDEDTQDLLRRALRNMDREEGNVIAFA